MTWLTKRMMTFLKKMKVFWKKSKSKIKRVSIRKWGGNAPFSRFDLLIRGRQVMRILIEEDTHLSGFKGIIYSSCGRFRLPKALSFAGRSCTLSVRGIQKAGTQARTSTADDITLRLS